jgi:hypothetical protein
MLVRRDSCLSFTSLNLELYIAVCFYIGSLKRPKSFIIIFYVLKSLNSNESMLRAHLHKMHEPCPEETINPIVTED